MRHLNETQKFFCAESTQEVVRVILVPLRRKFDFVSGSDHFSEKGFLEKLSKLNCHATFPIKKGFILRQVSLEMHFVKTKPQSKKCTNKPLLLVH